MEPLAQNCVLIVCGSLEEVRMFILTDSRSALKAVPHTTRAYSYRISEARRIVGSLRIRDRVPSFQVGKHITLLFNGSGVDRQQFGERIAGRLLRCAQYAQILNLSFTAEIPATFC